MLLPTASHAVYTKPIDATKMKLTAVLISVGLLVLQSCFIGSDTFEKEVNECFWLHQDSESEETYLGTIDKGARFTDKYLGPIDRIGWDEEYILLKEKSGDYYIQPINKDQSIEKVKTDLVGPLTETEFKNLKQAHQVDEKLDFEIQY